MSGTTCGSAKSTTIAPCVGHGTCHRISRKTRGRSDVLHQSALPDRHCRNRRQLETGAAPWLKPWKTSVANGISLLPSNAATGRQYHGINIPILWHQHSVRGYPTHQWLTFNQAKEKGANVRKGEKATQVVFTKKLRIKDQETEEERQAAARRGHL